MKVSKSMSFHLSCFIKKFLKAINRRNETVNRILPEKNVLKNKHNSFVNIFASPKCKPEIFYIGMVKNMYTKDNVSGVKIKITSRK